MAGLRNIIWPEINQANAERIRAALDIPAVERGSKAWRSNVVGRALADWAEEIELNPNALDRKTVVVYAGLYADEVYVKRPWGGDKPPVFNASFTPKMEKSIVTIGQELERLNMANILSKSGYNRTAVVMLALDKYAKKLELTADSE